MADLTGDDLPDTESAGGGDTDWTAGLPSCRVCPVHPDPAARLAAVQRLPEFLLPIAMADPDPLVRREVARLIGEDWLAVMAWDRDATVRLIVARRLKPEQLSVLAGDCDERVRATVAHRGVPSALVQLANDRAEEVYRIARQRLGWHSWNCQDTSDARRPRLN